LVFYENKTNTNVINRHICVGIWLVFCFTDIQVSPFRPAGRLFIFGIGDIGTIRLIFGWGAILPLKNPLNTLHFDPWGRRFKSCRPE